MNVLEVAPIQGYAPAKGQKGIRILAQRTWTAQQEGAEVHLIDEKEHDVGAGDCVC